MKHSLTLPTLLTLALTFISCFGSKKDDDGTIIPPVPQDGRVVYLAGTYSENNKYGIPAVWKNGVRQTLPHYENEPGYDYSVIESIFVSNDNKVYVLGEICLYNNPLSGHYLWIDGVPQKLDMNAILLFVSGNDVYIYGSKEGIGRAIWKNGTIIITDCGNIRSIYVSGNDVYACYYGDDNGKTVILKNGTHLYDITDGAIMSLCVSSNDVYACGVYDSGTLIPGESEIKYNPCIWKNGVRQDLNTGKGRTQVRGMAVSGNDVYVAGSDDPSGLRTYATLWKNGVVQNLKDANITEGRRFSAYNISVLESDVYVLGLDMNNSVIWKNGEVYQRLLNATTNTMFVK